MPNPAVPASPRLLFAGGAERPPVSDCASALSWGNDESELVNELQAGAETAFDWLVNHYHAPSYNRILGMVGHTPRPADAVQAVLAKEPAWIRSLRRMMRLR